MYVRYLNNQRRRKGTVLFQKNRGVRQIELAQGLIEELPDYNPEAAPAVTKVKANRRKSKAKTDANPDTTPDDAAPDLERGNTEGSKAPTTVAPGEQPVRQRTFTSDSGS